jgi:hypothetical protein
MASRFSSGISEGCILFFQGGHDHNGISSSLIDTASYSIYDFVVGNVGSSSRQANQQKNFDSLKSVISNIVKTDVLGPSGVRLNPNSIQSIHIEAGAVTASELSANIVLVNNIIRSSNFDGNVAANGSITSNGTVGWAISGDGSAVFDSSYIRGTITAGAVSTPGIDIDANGNLTANAFSLFGNGAIVTSSGNFSVSAGGALSATGANISGQIDATSGTVGNWDISGGNIISSDGKISLINDDGDTVIIAQSDIGTFASLNGDGSIIALEDGIETSINVPYVFEGGTVYTFIVKQVSQPLNAVRIAPGKLFVTSPSEGIALDMTNGIFSTLPIQSTSTVEMETGQVNGIGIIYPGITTGPGTANYMGLVWNNPDIRGTVDNVVSAVLGTVSDVRSKSNILDAENTWLNKLYDSLRVVSFNPVDLLDEENLHLYPRRLGLIAQELNEILPDLVVSANPYDEEAFLSVNYLGLVPYLIQAVQDLNNRVKELESKV